MGAGLRSLSFQGRELLDGYGPGEIPPAGHGQVLAPWPNRLEGGRYEFGGTSQQLPINEVERANAIHGLVRWVNWRCRSLAPDRVVLGLSLHPQPGYSFALDLELDYSVGPSGLTVRLTATNAGDHHLPFGAGFHPYLTVGEIPIDRAILTLPAATTLPADDRGLPTGERAGVAGSGVDFRAPRVIGPARLDTCFTDLSRDPDSLARIRLRFGGGDRRVTLWMDEAFGFVMAYTGDTIADPARRRRSVAIEPMTCPPNAFVTGDALIRLDAGGSVSGRWGIAAG